jgi:hypothetical protein
VQPNKVTYNKASLCNNVVNNFYSIDHRDEWKKIKNITEKRSPYYLMNLLRKKFFSYSFIKQILLHTIKELDALLSLEIIEGENRVLDLEIFMNLSFGK